MRILITFLLGLTGGIAFIRYAEGLGRAARYGLGYFAAGVALGIFAAAVSLAVWGRE